MRPLAGCLLLAFVVSGCTSAEGTGDKGYVSGDGQVREFAVEDRGDPVDLVGEDLAGNPLSIEQFRGKPVVVPVWGSWCPPCRKEAPDLVEAAKELDGEAQFVGINVRDASSANAQGFERQFGVPYPSFYSSGGVELLAFDRALGPNTVPAIVVLDSDGRVAASVIGELPSKTTLLNLVETVRAESNSGPSDG